MLFNSHVFIFAFLPIVLFGFYRIAQWSHYLAALWLATASLFFYGWWIESDRKKALKIIKLIREVQRNPFEGTGQPEALKHDLSGCWSRRIDQEHRLVYEVLDDKIRILACRFHY